jgi:hypothetical protein
MAMTQEQRRLRNNETRRARRKAEAERLGVSQASLYAHTRTSPEATARSRAKIRKRNQEHVLAIKADTPCTDCGHKFPAVCMDFDHLDGDAKIKSISDLVQQCASVAAIDAELAKCELVCANCHRIRTATRASWNVACLEVAS